jgi:hypothetical protein
VRQTHAATKTGKWALFAVAVPVALTISWVAIGQSAPKLGTTPEAQRQVKGPLTTTPAEPEGAGEIPFISPRAHAVDVPSAPNAWGGPRTGKEATLSDRVVQYDIDAKLDPVKHTVDGQEKLTWRNRSQVPVRTVFLHLYLNAFENLHTTWFLEHHDFGGFRTNVPIKDGQWGWVDLGKVRQGQSDVKWRYVHPDGGTEADHTVVRLDLPEAVAPGASTTLDIAFHDQLPRVVARTGWWGTYHLVAQWFPKIGVLELPGERGATAPRWNVHEFHAMSEFYADWGGYDVHMTVPKNFQVASAGEEQGAPVEKEGWTTHHFVQNDIHDFAWMAVDNFAPPLEGAVDVPGGGHTIVKVFYPPDYVASAQPALKATIDSIKYFSETLGPYPYKTSTCVIPPFNAGESGGMEYQTFFTADSFKSVEPDTMNGMLLDFVVIHEFGHGYFYGLLASNEFEEPLLDEGLNEYWDNRMLRARNQAAHATTPFLKALGYDPVLDPFDIEHAIATRDPHLPDAIGQNAWNRMSGTTYGTVYFMTTTVMHDLEERLGHDVTERAFKQYYALWHLRHPSVADLRQTLEEVSGDKATVDDVFARYVYGVSHVDDRVTVLESEEQVPTTGTVVKDGKRVEATKKEVEKQIEEAREKWKKEHPKAKPSDGGPFAFRTVVIVRRDGGFVPQTLEVEFEDGTKERVKWDQDETWHRYSWVKPTKAKLAQLDPDRRFLLDGNKLNDGRSLEANRQVSRRLAGYFGSAAEILTSLVEAL